MASNCPCSSAASAAVPLSTPSTEAPAHSRMRRVALPLAVSPSTTSADHPEDERGALIPPVSHNRGGRTRPGHNLVAPGRRREG